MPVDLLLMAGTQVAAVFVIASTRGQIDSGQAVPSRFNDFPSGREDRPITV